MNTQRSLRIGAAGLVAAALTGTLAAAPAFAAPQQNRSGETRISDIQGPGDETPLKGQTVTTKPSVVTAVYPTSTGLNGFTIQEPGSGGRPSDLDRPSSGLFVYTGKAEPTVKVGETVRVTGVAGEYNGLTQLSGSIKVEQVPGRRLSVKPITTEWSTIAPSKRENLESMLYQSPEKFTVSDAYPLSRYGEIGLASGGELPKQPTDVGAPNSPAWTAQQQTNEQIQLTLDDGSNKAFAVTKSLPARQVPYMTESKNVSVGDTATLTEPVVIDYRFDKWRVQPTHEATPGAEPATISAKDHPRPDVSGDLTAASFNVLNYFTTTGEGRKGCTGGNLSTDKTYNVTFDCDVRGAWQQADFKRQQAKTVAAINQLDASVVGLMEIENSVKLGEAPDEALKNLTDALNAAAGTDKWAYVPAPANELEPVAEQDFITTAFIYQPAKATQVGTSHALGSQGSADGAFYNARTPIAATFAPAGGGDATTFVVNHFKSKGSGPSSGENADTGDGQGAWNAARVDQAKALVNWLPELNQQTGTDQVALLGDFNSYAQEDPMQVLYQAGFASAVQSEHYSYVYGGLAGSLDHFLINKPLAEKRTDAGVWNINGGESPLLQYATYRTTALDYYRADPFGSSDHDPVLAGFKAN